MIYTQKKCDALLTPIIKKLYPKCLLCGGDTQVAHHHIHKSKGGVILRYCIDNLVPLCMACHLRLHYNESYWASKIVAIRGLGWFKKIDKLKYKTEKPDYEAIYKKLDKELQKY